MALRRRNRDQRGAAAVEFALILPIFLMVLFGIIDFGYAINRASLVNNAARDAVREASFGATEAQVKAVADVTLEGIPNYRVVVSCKKKDNTPCAWTTDAKSGAGVEAIVRVEYRHEFITPVSMFFSGGLDLSRQAVMRIEG